MAQSKEVAAPIIPSVRAFTLDGSKTRWPSRVDKLEVSVKVPAPLTTLPESLAPCFASVDALNHLLDVQVFNAMLGALDGWLKEQVPNPLATDVTPEGEKTVARSAIVIDKEIHTFLAAVTIAAPKRKRGQEKKVGAVAKVRKELAETQARTAAIESQKAALIDVMRSMLAAQPDTPERAASIASMIEAKTLPADFAL